MLDPHWYHNINIIALLLLWLLYWVSHKFFVDVSCFEQVAQYSMMAVAIYFVIAQMTGVLAGNVPLIVEGLALFLLAMVAWETISGFWLVFNGNSADNSAEPELEVATVTAIGESSDIVDLDELDPRVAARRERVRDAVSDAFGEGDGETSRARRIGKLLEAIGEDEEEDEDVANWEVATVIIGTLPLLPPCLYAAKVLLNAS